MMAIPSPWAAASSISVPESKWSTAAGSHSPMPSAAFQAVKLSGNSLWIRKVWRAQPFDFRPVADVGCQIAAADRVDHVVVEPDRMQPLVRAPRQDDRRIERIADPVVEMRPRVDVDMQHRMAAA